MKIFFTADKSSMAMQALRACIKRYGQADLDKAEVVIVLGGDGFMLKTLQRLLNYQTPVFGLNFGHVGYLLNHYTNEDLSDRVQNAHPLHLTPIVVKAEPFVGKTIESYAFNDFSVMRQSPQAARLSTVITDEKDGHGIVSSHTVFGDGIIVSTPIGSHGYYQSAGGCPLPDGVHTMGVKSVCCKDNFNPIVSENGHIVITPQEPQKRPIHLDCDGKKRFKNIALALIESAPKKTQTLLVERKQSVR